MNHDRTDLTTAAAVAVLLAALVILVECGRERHRPETDNHYLSHSIAKP